MKKLILLIILLLGSVSVDAAHHRGHVLEFANSTLKRLNSVDYGWRKFNDTYVCRDGRWVQCANNRARINNIKNNLILIRRDLEYVRDNSATGDLDTLRGRVTAPRREAPGTPTDQRVFAVMYNLSQTLQLVNLTGEERNRLLPMQRNLAHLWEDLDRVIWHIQDAIREEVYEDPAFAEQPQ